MDKSKIELRNINLEIELREIEEGGEKRQLYGMPIVFSQQTNIGQFDEIIEPTALDETDLRDVRLLVNHNTNMIPLARSRNNNENSTMQLIPTEQGLAMRANLDTENNAEAKSLLSAVERGDISGMSFMMIVGDDKWENARSSHPVRHITKIDRVLELSVVTFPAYAQTSIEARGLAEALESVPASLESERANIAEVERKRKQLKLKLEVNADDN